MANAPLAPNPNHGHAHEHSTLELGVHVAVEGLEATHTSVEMSHAIHHLHAHSHSGAAHTHVSTPPAPPPSAPSGEACMMKALKGAGAAVKAAGKAAVSAAALNDGGVSSGTVTSAAAAEATPILPLDAALHGVGGALLLLGGGLDLYKAFGDRPLSKGMRASYAATGAAKVVVGLAQAGVCIEETWQLVGHASTATHTLQSAALVPLFAPVVGGLIILDGARDIYCAWRDRKDPRAAAWTNAVCGAAKIAGGALLVTSAFFPPAAAALALAGSAVLGAALLFKLGQGCWAWWKERREAKKRRYAAL